MGKGYQISENEAYERVFKSRGFEQRPDGLYKNGKKVERIEAPKITGKAARDLVAKLRELDLYRARSMTRSGSKVIR